MPKSKSENGHQPDVLNVQPTADDFVLLFQRNPLAGEQIKSIVLERLLREERAKHPVPKGA